MKFKRTTSPEKAVVFVFVVSLPLGIFLGHHFKQIPEPEVREKIVVRTLPIEDYQPAPEPEVVDPGCREAWDATVDVIEQMDEYNTAVSQLEPIIERLYGTVMGNDPNDVGELNAIRNEVDHHKRGDWARLSMTGSKLDRLESTMKQCADVPE